MFERDSNPNQISSIGRWKKSETKTALQVNLQSGSMGLKWFHDSNPWFLKRCQGKGFYQFHWHIVNSTESRIRPNKKPRTSKFPKSWPNLSQKSK